MRNKLKLLLFLLIIIPALLCCGCILSNDKPKKVNVPKVDSISIKNGDIITSPDFELTIKGNSLAELFQYELDSVVSAWFDTSAVTLTALSEGSHILIVRAKKDTLISKELTVEFTVDAISGPGIIFEPRKVETVTFVTVYLEDVFSLMAAHIEIDVTDESALITDFTESAVYGGDGQRIIFAEEQDSKKIILDIAFAGAADGVDGRIELGRFLVRPLGTQGFIEIDSLSVKFRDVDNKAIDLNVSDRVRVVQ